MPKFRKKPVVIEAYHLVGSFALADDLAEWCGGKDHHETKDAGEGRLMEWPTITISTLEGDMVASPGDYIIKGVNGEFYPCKPDIFEKTYEPVDE